MKVPQDLEYYKEIEITKGGLGLMTAAFFIVGEMAGSGILALPNAIAGAGKFLLLYLTKQWLILFWPL